MQLPTTYTEWRYFIEGTCGLSLTPEFVAERIGALRDSGDPLTARFAELYGEDQLASTLEWFEQAARDLAPTN